MRNRHYSASGMDSHNFGHLEDNSTLDISGMGSVDIGSIGQNVTINKSGMGSLNIRGSVHATAKFNISGMGSTNFTPDHRKLCLITLENSGMGSVNVPGGYTSKSPSSSAGTYVSDGGSMIINGAVINGGGVMRNLVMDSSGIRYTDASGKNVYIPNETIVAALLLLQEMYITIIQHQFRNLCQTLMRNAFQIPPRLTLIRLKINRNSLILISTFSCKKMSATH